METKEIHFHKDLIGVPHEKFIHFFHSHNSTDEAIRNNVPIIYTTAISALCFSSLLDKGYTIVLHENGKEAICHEGTTVMTDKELRKGHCIDRIWIGGGFANYFYSDEQIPNPYNIEE